MSTRNIKNARDLESNELIYFKSHAQATFMSDGSTVEDTINDIKENGGGDLSNYVTTEQLNTSLSGKQDKLVSGTNIKTINGESILGNGDITTPTFLRIGDADDEAKANFIAVAKGEKSADYYICSSKIEGMPVNGIVTRLYMAGPSSSPIVGYTFYGSPMDGSNAGKLLKITTRIVHWATGEMTTTYEAVLDAKQNTITDLEDIREGAAKGATAAQLYITDFDVLSLESLAQNPDGIIQSDNREITEALAANKIVLVPYEISDNVSIRGYATLVGYAEDLLYFKVITDNYEIIVETRYDGSDIRGQEVILRSWGNKQDLLVSGTNIKTINGNSILGSGDIEVAPIETFEDRKYVNVVGITDDAFLYALPTSANGDEDDVIATRGTLKTINGQTLFGSGDIEISGGGGSSDANVQAVDTGDVIDDVNVDYATTAYVDNKVASIDLTNYATTDYVDSKVASIDLTDYATTDYVNELIGDINSVLESIINS